MKNRNLPYGYQYIDGAVAICSGEQAVVGDICSAYLNGQSLLSIANWLNEKSVEYMPGVTGWNKARIKHIIEDKRYLGGEYPAILDEEMYAALQAIKSSRNTQRAVDRAADIFQINVPVQCPACGSPMQRHHDSRRKRPQRWVCKDHNCHKLIGKSDKEMLDEITALLNMAITNPDIIHATVDTQQSPSIEVQQLDHEINRALESFDCDKDILRKKMLMRASLMYQDIASDIYIFKRLRADFAAANPLSVFSADLFARTVKAICFDESGAISLILTNDQQIRKEQIDGSNSSR